MDQQDNDLPIRKPFYKKWYFWASLPVVLLITAGLVMSYIGKQQDKYQAEQHKKEASTGSDRPEGQTAHNFDSSLPTCPSSLSGLFTHEMFDLADLDFVVPLGRVDAGVHTIPTDHMYINHYGHKKIAIYAPTDMTLISMDDKMTYLINGDQFLHDDYSIEFAPCRGLSVYFNHFSEIIPKIKTAFDNSHAQCDNQPISFGTNATTYYKACQSQFKLEFKSGDLLGYVGTFVGGEKITATGMDLGVYNLNGTAKDFANPDRYSPYNLHSLCGIDLFTDSIKNTYYQKLGSLAKDQTTIEWRKGEPLCGTDMQDIKGTLAGNWFFGSPIKEGPTNSQYYLALVHDVADFNKGALSWQGQPGNFTSRFTPTHIGTTDREFSEVKPSDQIYCYNNDVSAGLNIIDANGKPKSQAKSKFLLELVDATHLKVEKQDGVCGASEKFNSPYTYER